MRVRILAYGLVLLTIISVVNGFIMGDFLSLILGIALGFLADLSMSGSKPEAPHAEKEETVLGSAGHQLVYLKALQHCKYRIEHDRANGGHLAPVNSDWHRRYVHDKWTYALVYHRYKTTQKQYGWWEL